MTLGAIIQVAFVEDDEALGEAAAQALTLEGAQVSLFRDARAALKTLSADFPGVVVSDIRMPGMDGLAFFDRLREIDADIPLIFTTGHGDVAMAVEAMKNGASDFLTKPYASARLLQAVKRAAEKRALVLENRHLRMALGERAKSRILGSSPASGQLRNVISAVARSDIDVMLEGQAGTGKTFAARLIHDLGPRSNRPFVAVDGGILAHQDAELLLFGRHPAAGLSRTGLIERANGGTLFLDEIEAARGNLRTRLASLLETRSVLPLGADRPRRLDIRIIVASLADGADATLSDHAVPAPGTASDALGHRLGTVRVTLPPLAARREDIPEFFRHFVAKHERELDIASRPVGDLEWRRIQTHDWPGNLTELNGFARAFVLGLSGVGTHAAQMPHRSLQDIVGEFEKAILEDELRKVRGNVTQLQTALNTPRKTIYDKLARYRLKPGDFR
jgi:two-component system C4-dicarboxylate transport response regulator DctD